MERKLKFHETKLLRKTNFVNWKKTTNVRELQVLRKYHIQRADDYKKYNKICNLIKKLVLMLTKLPSQDEFREQLTNKLIEKAYELGLIPTRTSIVSLSNLPASAFCRRRLAVILVRYHFCENLKQATTYIEQGQIRVGPTIITDPAYHVTRSMEDFVTWTDTSKIKKKVLAFNDKLDDFDLLE